MSVVIQDSEIKLLEYLKQIEGSFKNHYAVFFHLSKLLDKNRSDFQIKIGINVISDFFKKCAGSLFLLRNHDLVVIIENGNHDMVKKIIYQLRYLFIDDELAFKNPEQENPDFSDLYILKNDWNDFVRVCREKIDQNHLQNLSKISNSNIPLANTNPSLDRLVKAYNFSKIENDLQKVDLTRLIRKQNISILMQDKNVKPIFTELYVNILHLRDHLQYSHSFLDNKLLFRYFTESVDNKLLSFIKNDINKYITSATNLNLSIETILSEDFLEFHKMIKSMKNIQMVIDFDLSDVFLDLNSFYYANQFLKELGYKTCLDGIDNYSFIHIDRRGLDFDLIKLNWDPDAASAVDFTKMKDVIQKCNPNRVILTNCTDDESLQYGYNLGLFLFQGWWLEKMNQQKIVA